MTCLLAGQAAPTHTNVDGPEQPQAELMGRTAVTRTNRFKVCLGSYDLVSTCHWMTFACSNAEDEYKHWGIARSTDPVSAPAGEGSYEVRLYKLAELPNYSGLARRTSPKL